MKMKNQIKVTKTCLSSVFCRLSLRRSRVSPERSELRSRRYAGCDRPTSPLASLLSRFALALFTFHFSLFISSAHAEEWGFSFSGQILEVVDGAKGVAHYTNASAGYSNATTYDADVFIRLYDDSEKEQTAKTGALWGRKIHVNVKNGNYSCELKDSAGDVLTAAYTNLQDAVSHLGGSTVTVGVTPFDDENAEIDPRQKLSSVTFAVNAGDALGTVGDITIPGTLTTGAAEAPNVSFLGAVTHRGEVTFESDPSFPSLTLASDEPLVATRLAVEADVELSELSANRLAAGEATVALKTVNAGIVSNLTVKGSVSAADAKDLAGKLTVDGDLTARKTLNMKNLVLGGGADLFKWEDKIVKLEKGSSGQEGYYTDTGSGGSWTVPEATDGHILVSLNFNLGDGGSVSVTVDGLTVGTLSTGKAGWMSLQVIVAPGQEIAWSGSSSIEFYYRKFRY